ncbi:hypothetical protein ACFGW0_01775 [Pasteurella multocida]
MYDRTVRQTALETYVHATMSNELRVAKMNAEHKDIRHLSFFLELDKAVELGLDDISVMEYLIKKCYWSVRQAMVVYTTSVMGFLKEHQSNLDAAWVLQLGMEHAPFKTGAKVLTKNTLGEPVVGVIQPPIAPELNKTGRSLIKTAESVIVSHALTRAVTGFVGVATKWEDIKLIARLKDD